MKTKILKGKEIEFKKISYNETDGVGTFFRANEELGITGPHDVLMVMDQDYLQNYEEGELVLNLSKSMIVYVPFCTKVILLNNTNETIFEETSYEEPEE